MRSNATPIGPPSRRGITDRTRPTPPAPAFGLKHAEHLEDDDDNDNDSDDVKDVFVHIRTGIITATPLVPTYLRLARPTGRLSQLRRAGLGVITAGNNGVSARYSLAQANEYELRRIPGERRVVSIVCSDPRIPPATPKNPCPPKSSTSSRERTVPVSDRAGVRLPRWRPPGQQDLPCSTASSPGRWN